MVNVTEFHDSFYINNYDGVSCVGWRLLSIILISLEAATESLIFRRIFKNSLEFGAQLHFRVSFSLGPVFLHFLQFSSLCR